MSSKNRIFYVQILIDSVHIYNSYKYDSSYNNLKIVISKFLKYPPVDIARVDFNSNPDEGTAEVKINQGKTYTFPMAANIIESTLSKAYIDFDILLESNDQDKVEAGIQFLTVGHTRLQLKENLKGLINAVGIVQSDKPEITELEGPFVIRRADLQVGTIFLGLRLVMFGSSLAATIQPGLTRVDPSPLIFSPVMFKATTNNLLSNGKTITEQNSLPKKDAHPITNQKHKPNSSEPSKDTVEIVKPESMYSLVASELFENDHSEDPQSLNSDSNKLESNVEDRKQFDRVKEGVQILKNQLKRFNTGPFELRSKEPAKSKREPMKNLGKSKDPADLEREYTHVYSEMNGQATAMKIVYEPKAVVPTKMIASKCL